MTRINEAIRIPEVRVIDPEGKTLGILKTEDAIKKAEEFDLDLVEVAPAAKPPVCRIMDFSKFKYEKEKKDKEARKKSKTGALKEVRFRPRIDPHDYQVKLDHAREFLQKGHKVRLRLQFRGREMAHQEMGMEVIHKAIKELEDAGKVDKPVESMGRMLLAVLVPVK